MHLFYSFSHFFTQKSIFLEQLSQISESPSAMLSKILLLRSSQIIQSQHVQLPSKSSSPSYSDTHHSSELRVPQFSRITQTTSVACRNLFHNLLLPCIVFEGYWAKRFCAGQAQRTNLWRKSNVRFLFWTLSRLLNFSYTACHTDVHTLEGAKDFKTNM